MIPPTFASKIITLFGDKGRAWLAALPSHIQLCIKQWNLVDVKPFDNLSYNYVATAYSNDRKETVVLKIGIDSEELKKELYALEWYAGNGCVTVFDKNLSHNALLLEYLQPGISLKTFFPQKENEAIEYTATVIQKLHKKIIDLAHQVPQLPTIKEVLSPLYSVTATIPRNHLDKAQELAEQLISTTHHNVVLHGDLHHENILSSNRTGYVAIDPKGIIGDPAYEVGAFVRNPMPELLAQPDSAKIIQKRLESFAKLLHIDQERLRQWSYVQAVLSACWALEDRTSWQQWIKCAEILNKLK